MVGLFPSKSEKDKLVLKYFVFFCCFCSSNHTSGIQKVEQTVTTGPVIPSALCAELSFRFVKTYELVLTASQMD